MPSSVKHELKAILALMNLIEKKLNKYPQTLQGSKDLIELSEHDKQEKLSYGAQIIVEEQLALHSILDACIKVSDYLTMNR